MWCHSAVFLSWFSGEVSEEIPGGRGTSEEIAGTNRIRGRENHFAYGLGGRREYPRRPTVTRRSWTNRELLAVLSRYTAEGPLPLAAELGRSVHAVSSLARRCGLRTPRKPYRSSKGNDNRAREKAIRV